MDNAQLDSPVPVEERMMLLDVIRAVALFGVCFVNVETLFRVSLFQHIVEPHTDPGWLNYAVDDFLTYCVEFKAFPVFCFLFGVGAGIQMERRRKGLLFFFARRYFALFLIGILHIILLWNGDILSFYGVCGLLLLPFVFLPGWWQVGLAALVLAGYQHVLRHEFPGADAMISHSHAAAVVYGTGYWTRIALFRINEFGYWIIPLAVPVMPKIFGLMLLGMGLWRTGMLKKPLSIKSSNIVLRALAATGRMALTNYLGQSIIFSFVFYGFGLGLFARLASAPTALIAIAVFVTQSVISMWWLKSHRYGPTEYLWRVMTYGRRMTTGPRDAALG